MNRHEEKRLTKIEIEVGNNTKQLERIVTNDLPHIYQRLWRVVGSLWVLIPLVMILTGLVVGLYFV